MFVGKPEGKRPSRTLRLHRKIIVKYLFKKSDGKTWTGLMWLCKGTSGRLL